MKTEEVKVKVTVYSISDGKETKIFTSLGDSYEVVSFSFDSYELEEEIALRHLESYAEEVGLFYSEKVYDLSVTHPIYPENVEWHLVISDKPDKHIVGIFRENELPENVIKYSSQTLSYETSEVFLKYGRVGFIDGFEGVEEGKIGIKVPTNKVLNYPFKIFP